MKTLHFFPAAIVTALAILSQPPVQGKEIAIAPISTGSVVSVDPDHATMVIETSPDHRALTFYGMNSAQIQTSAGRVVPMAEVTPKTPVTVYYTSIEGRWHVGKVLIPETQTVAPALTSAEEKALRSKAANDGDITTEPGVKARIDDDITTQPGKKDPRDPDITKRTDR